MSLAGSDNVLVEIVVDYRCSGAAGEICLGLILDFDLGQFMCKVLCKQPRNSKEHLTCLRYRGTPFRGVGVVNSISMKRAPSSNIEPPEQKKSKKYPEEAIRESQLPAREGKKDCPKDVVDYRCCPSREARVW